MSFRRSVLALLSLFASVGSCWAVEPAAQPSSGSEEIRVFIALPVPEDVADPLMAEQDRLRKSGFKFHGTRRDDLHLTLLFLGEIPVAKVDELTRALEGVATRTACFDLTHRGLGYFTKGEDAEPFVIWAGCGSGWKPLADLADAVSEASGKVGLPPRRGSFRAHVTLGRPTDSSQGDSLKKDLDSRRQVELGGEHVSRFVLYRTLKNGTAASFQPLHEFKLKESPR